MSKILLDNLTEYQKSLLTRFSYIDINIEQFRALQTQGKITIINLRDLILYPNKTYLGDLNISSSTRIVTGVNITNIEFFEKLIEAGLGDLEIVDISADKTSGFNGICFKDSKENTGFSFRGTDVKTLDSLIKDGMADIEAFLTNYTDQIEQANQFFKKHQNSNSQNYLYGHSLGGFLAENVYLQNHNDIANTFVINPLHINSIMFNMENQIEAFNDSQKFSCFVTGGDYVSEINPPTQFMNNVKYVKNNNHNVNNIIGNHLIEAAEMNPDGSFVQCSKEEAYKGHSTKLASYFIKLINNNRIKSFFGKTIVLAKDLALSFKNRFKRLFNRNKSLQAPNTLTKTSTVKASNFEQSLNPENYVGKNYSLKDLSNAKFTISHGKSQFSPTPKSRPGERLH